jgi:hypothetical protein
MKTLLMSLNNKNIVKPSPTKSHNRYGNTTSMDQLNDSDDNGTEFH